MTYVLAYTVEESSVSVGLGEKLVTVHWLLTVTLRFRALYVS